jgi:hypothetical protein
VARFVFSYLGWPLPPPEHHPVDLAGGHLDGSFHTPGFTLEWLNAIRQPMRGRRFMQGALKSVIYLPWPQSLIIPSRAGTSH